MAQSLQISGNKNHWKAAWLAWLTWELFSIPLELFDGHCGPLLLRLKLHLLRAVCLQVSAAPVLSDLRWQDLRRSNASTLRSELLGYLCSLVNSGR